MSEAHRKPRFASNPKEVTGVRHSVSLNLKKCRGCTTCIKSCPTEAIRVRSGKATILPNRCIEIGRAHV